MKENEIFYKRKTAKLYDFIRKLETKSDQKVTNNIITNIKDGHKILEIGCGTGLLCMMMLRHLRTLKNISYIGTDISSSMIDICKSKTDEICFEQANGTNLKYKES